jgi:S1-C subfamily serine protease
VRGRSVGALVGVAAVVLVAATACTVVYKHVPSGSPGTTSAPGATASNYGAVAPDLVVVNSTLGEQQARAAGTGIVLTSNGEVLTNNHVIAGATSVQAVDVGNGRTYTATVTGYDRSHDVAVLRLQGASGLAVAPLNTRSRPTVGEHVAAVGNAGGTGRLTTVPGAITALNESVSATDQSSGSSEQLTGLIAVDADVQPGDSGGPLVDAAGRVIGITTAAGTGFSFQPGSASGYAIPIGNALPIRSLIDAGRTTGTVHVGPTAQLGVEVSAVQPGGGPVVVGVVPDQPAADAGIVPGDTITALGGTAVGTPTALVSVIDRYHPGRSVALAWTDRFGQRHSATITLATGPAG